MDYKDDLPKKKLKENQESQHVVFLLSLVSFFGQTLIKNTLDEYFLLNYKENLLSNL